MSFQPVLPLTGYAGWTFLKRTKATQQAAMQADSTQKRDEDYFRARIGTIKTAKGLVADRRLLNVALTAFGLQDDISYKAFLEKILEGGTLSGDGLANKLSDKRYFEFSKAFGFGDYAVPRNQMSDFPDKILALYHRQGFETAVGAQNDSYRLALNAEHALADIATGSGGVNTKWFSILGSAPLREVIQGALGLPSSFASIDLDQQLKVVKQRAQAVFGSSDPATFAHPDQVDKLVRSYLIRTEITGTGQRHSPASIALQILGA
ncbi:DUF1217 domain-containing protein [Neotabrizicola sp. sgz301269]|uniref:DUF1217 domain-containing protein n=1 Tax=Neotabrizicola sp. sgz301269 TaxID=3276282 RepID=UPI00376F97BA